MNSGRLKAGPLTAALGLIIVGGVLLLKNFAHFTWLDQVWRWWPLLLVGLGVEFLVKQKLSKEGEVRFHWPSLLLLLILLFGVGIGAAVEKVASSRVLNWPDCWPPNTSEQTKTFQSGPINIEPGKTRVKLTTHVGRVVLVPAPDNKLSVQAVLRAHGLNQAAAERMLQEAKINVSAKQADLVEISDFSPGLLETRSLEIDYRIQVPRGVKSLETNSSLGDVRAEGLSADLVITNDVGRVTAAGLGGSLKVVGSAGEVSVNQVQGNVSVANQLGRVIIKDPRGSVTVSNQTGEVKLMSSKPLNKDYSLQTTLGAVTVELPANSDLQIHAESRLGSISGSTGLFPEERAAGGPGVEKSAQLGSGQGKLSARTDTGAVKIKVN